MTRRLAKDETIRTVWPYLTHQKPYVSGVLQKMRQCNFAHGNSSVRIGVTGTGQKPYYRINYVDPDGHEMIFGSFYDNHEPLEDGFVVTLNWSTASMSLQELLDFYAEAIGYQGKQKHRSVRQTDGELLGRSFYCL
jgi:hypothetical protein